MQSIVGFLLQTEVYSVEIPADVSPDFELSTTVGYSPASPVGIQAAPSARVDFSSFGWGRKFQAQAGTATVDVYEDPADTDALMPAWELGGYTIWSQLRAQVPGRKSTMLADYVAGCKFNQDSYGIPRLRLRGGLVPGSPYTHAINRDHAIYLVPGTTETLVLRFDEGLAADGGIVSGDFVNAAVATPLGITVLYSSDSQPHAAVIATATTVANSIKLIRQ